MEFIEKKVVLIGPHGVGKTRAVRELLDGEASEMPQESVEFAENQGIDNEEGLDHLMSLGLVQPATSDWKYFPTLGVEVTPYTIQLEDGGVQKNIQVSIWDTSGPDKRGELNTYLNNVDFIVIFINDDHDIEPYIKECGDTPYTIINNRDDLKDVMIQMTIGSVVKSSHKE